MELSSKFMLIFLLILQAVWANVYIGFPFSQQLPDVARVGETYKFTINSQTFKSDNDGSVSYNAFELPSWMSFDSSSLTFNGSPSNNDTIGDIEFILQGSDADSSMNQSCTIYLSNQPSIQLNTSNSVETQLQTFGYTNGYGGIVLDPQNSFSFSFSKNTFQVPSSSENTIVAYYGKSANKTSLPSWCFFDESSLTFSGTTPPVNSEDAPSLQFDLTLIATDYADFSAASSTFRIVVGGHTLYIKNSTSYNNTLMTNAGETVTFDLPISDIYLDDSPITSDQISQVIAYDAPSWVSIEDNSKLVADIPEDQTENLVVNVTLFDTYEDSVYMNFDINVIHSIFEVDSISNVTAMPGELFKYSLPESYFKNESATDVAASFSDTWLTFYHSNNTFIGVVPNDFEETEIEIDATMNSLSQKMNFFIVSNKQTSSSMSSSSTSLKVSSSYSSSIASTTSGSNSYSITTSTTSATSSTAYSSGSVLNTVRKSSNSNTKALAIGLGVGIPVFLIIAVAILLFFCCFGKRRKNNNKDNEKDLGDSTFMETSNTNDTLVFNNKPTIGAALAQKNLSALEKNDNDQESYYSNTSTLTDKSTSSLYHDANNQSSKTELLRRNNPHINAEDSEILNSWRNSSAGGFKARDSLSSLATVATSDLLTVNVVNEDKIRKSQMLVPPGSIGKYNSSSDSIINNKNVRNSNANSLSKFNSDLEPLREADDDFNISRDTSYGTMSTEAQLVGFNNSGSLYRTEQPEQQSYRGELSSISGDENDFYSQSSNANSFNTRL